jgi:SRSO17 transposase
MAQRLAPYFARSESRQRVMAYLRGLLREAERKPSWHVAEVCGEPTPDGCPYVLSRADWEANAVRDELRIDVMQHLGDPHGVLVLDATGCLKQGAHSAGVARQYRGTAGNVEHGQIGVLLSDASARGQVLLDRERDVPKAWSADGARGRPGSQQTGWLPPSHSWPAQCGPAPSRLACPRSGFPATASMGTTGACGWGGRAGRRRLS